MTRLPRVRLAMLIVLVALMHLANSILSLLPDVAGSAGSCQV